MEQKKGEAKRRLEENGIQTRVSDIARSRSRRLDARTELRRRSDPDRPPREPPPPRLRQDGPFLARHRRRGSSTAVKVDVRPALCGKRR